MDILPILHHILYLVRMAKMGQQLWTRSCTYVFIWCGVPLWYIDPFNIHARRHIKYTNPLVHYYETPHMMINCIEWINVNLHIDARQRLKSIPAKGVCTHLLRLNTESLRHHCNVAILPVPINGQWSSFEHMKASMHKYIVWIAK